MSKQPRPDGTCRLCGYFGKLSFEHIPPRSAFNGKPRIYESVAASVGRDLPYSKFDKGLGRWSLCEQCNTRTGAWYGKAFADWTAQAAEILARREPGAPSEGIILPVRIYPLNVLKQVLVMAVAMTNGSPRSQNSLQELRACLLSKTSGSIPDKYCIMTYLNPSGQPRFESEMVIGQLGKGSLMVLAEIALWPLGYVVAIPDDQSPLLIRDLGLTEISWFVKFPYNVWTHLFLQLPEKETYEPFPLDYRDRSQLLQHYEKIGEEWPRRRRD